MTTAAPEVESLFAQGTAFHEAGQLAEAERIYNQVLAMQPQHLDSLYLLGVIYHQHGNYAEAIRQTDFVLTKDPEHIFALNTRGETLLALGQFDRAISSFDRALAVEPDYAEALYHRGNALCSLRRYEEAVSSYDRTLALQPDLIEAHLNRGSALHALGRYEIALVSHDRALTLRPDCAEAHFNRGNTLQKLKRLEEALASYEHALVLRPDLVEAELNRGNNMYELTRYEEALACYDRAVASRPDYGEALFNRGNTLKELGRFADALASYDRALAVQPDNAAVHFNCGLALYELKKFDEALASYDRALALQPNYAEALTNRGNVLHELKRHEGAITSYDRALALRPDLADALNNKGNVLNELGRLQEAQQAYRDALRVDPNMVRAYLHLADSKQFVVGDPDLATMKALTAKTMGFSKADRMRLDFALAKAYADLGDFHGSFTHLLAGNVAKRATISYDETSTLAAFDRIEAIFTRELIEAKSGNGDPSPLPIFVIGMPRSGTTLVEQIIASHPMVYGAGELRTFGGIVKSTSGSDGNGMSYPEFVPAIDAAVLRQIGARYVATVRELVASFTQPQTGAVREGVPDRVTDKLPSNYYYTGLIHLALPNATIIHTVRDPVDTCISCFSRLFTAEQNHTYDLGELGRYYRRYHQLMAHWRRVLPARRILDVAYEDVVADFEGQVRRIISHCKLPWDDRCLSFHKTERPVLTASATQVRKPIYNTAVGRWRVYEQQVRPLLDALGVNRSLEERGVPSTET